MTFNVYFLWFNFYLYFLTTLAYSSANKYAPKARQLYKKLE